MIYYAGPDRDAFRVQDFPTVTCLHDRVGLSIETLCNTVTPRFSVWTYLDRAGYGVYITEKREGMTHPHSNTCQFRVAWLPDPRHTKATALWRQKMQARVCRALIDSAFGVGNVAPKELTSLMDVAFGPILADAFFRFR